MNFKLINNKYNIDIILMFSIVSILVLGSLFVYSSDYSYYSSSEVSNMNIYNKHIISIVIGLILCLIVSRINYRNLEAYWGILYIFSLLILLFVLLFGTTVNGSKSWIRVFGSFNFQPSEFCKILFIFSFASLLKLTGNNINKLFHLLKILIFPIPIIFLILMQPDPGTAVVFIPIIICMLIIAGVSFRYISFLFFVGFFSLCSTFYFSSSLIKFNKCITQNNLNKCIKNNFILSQVHSIESLKQIYKILHSKSELKTKLKYINKVNRTNVMYFVTGVGGFCLLVVLILGLFYLKYNNVYIKFFGYIYMVFAFVLVFSGASQSIIKPYHFQRIFAIMDLDKDPRGVSYHQRQSIVAIGAGGLKGQGWLCGKQNNLNFIPEKSNDFIFAVIAEEWGFIKGATLLFLLYILILYRILVIALYSSDSFGTYVSVGIASMIFTHIIVNIGMSIGMFPVMGIPLIFVSAGGTSLVSSLIAIGIVMNISIRRFIY